MEEREERNIQDVTKELFDQEPKNDIIKEIFGEEDETFCNTEKWEETLSTSKKKEIRRRKQFYTSLELLSNQISIFDTMTKETFSIVLHAKKIANYFQLEEVTEEILVLACLSKKTLLKQKLENSELDFSLVFGEFMSKNKVSPPSFFSSVLYNFQEKVLLKRTGKFSKGKKKLNFSPSALNLFLKTAKNAVSRFKTVIISPEILFLTLMEEKEFLSHSLILNACPTKRGWSVLRYRLLKRVYFEEASTKNSLKESEYLYIYLLRTRFGQQAYKNLSGYKLQAELSLAYRIAIFESVLKWKRFEFLEHQTYSSIKIHNLLAQT